MKWLIAVLVLMLGYGCYRMSREDSPVRYLDGTAGQKEMARVGGVEVRSAPSSGSLGPLPGAAPAPAADAPDGSFLVGSYRFRNVTAPQAPSGVFGEGSSVVLVPELQAWAYRVPENRLGQLVALCKSLDVLRGSYVVDVVFGLADLRGSDSFSVGWLYRVAGSEVTGALAGFSAAPSEAVVGGGRVVLNGADFEVLLESASSTGRLVVVARPRLQVLEGEASEMSTGTEVPVFSVSQNASTTQTGIEFKRVLSSLTATVNAELDGRVRLLVAQTRDQVTGVVELAGSEVPSVSTQSVESLVRVSLGEWVAVGSLRVDEVEELRRSIFPWLPPFFGGGRSDSSSRVELVLLARVTEGSAFASPPPLAVSRGPLERPLEFPEGHGGVSVPDVPRASAVSGQGPARSSGRDGRLSLTRDRRPVPGPPGRR